MISNRVFAFALAIMLILVGCSSSNNTQQQGAQSATSSAAVSDTESPKLTDEEKNQIVDFVQSTYVKNVQTLISSFVDVNNLIATGDYETLITEATLLNGAVDALEEQNTPSICETMKYNLSQAGRSMAVALLDYSDVAQHPDKDMSAEYEEGNEYVGKATEYIKAFNTEMARLTELASR